MPNMRRAISHKLQAWSESSHRKPLVIFGARQVGKTYAIKQLASDRYDSLAYIDFSRDARAAALFDASLAPAELVPKLEVFLHTLIDPDRTLIVFDEVQLCERALTSLKYFCDDAPQYHVVAAGSLLGVALKRELYSFPVGKVDLLQLRPLSFEEFLWARGETRLADAIRDAYENAPDQAFALHDRAMQLVHEYELIGGMPEIVSAYVANDGPRHRRNGICAQQAAGNQRGISRGYGQVRHTHGNAAHHGRMEQHSQQLAKENHKFQYKLIKSGGRAAIYENAIAWLDAAGIIMRCTQVTEATAPLKTFENSSSFKIYTADVGLLSAQYEAIPQDLEPATDKAAGFRGGITENYVLQQLVASDSSVYYWGTTSKAEVEFIARAKQGDVIPIEVKSGRNVTARSLESFRERYHPPYLVRVSARNFGVGNGIRSIPLYAAWLLGEDLQ
ncbi:putative ATPase [Bifidobacterium pullorum]|uniref:Putative ATPase n=1 Tax=Bifidobacterium pullorum TaxID=78448 RepID=A0A7V8HP40_9BIFI|nr:putative ATPase [Bifidobacterium pullorum]